MTDSNFYTDTILHKQEGIADKNSAAEVREWVEYILGLIDGFKFAEGITVDEAEELISSVKSAGYDRLLELSHRA
ncbi:TPA: hypothetical protein ACP32N_005020 [Pseudomonas aeruginosa]